MSENSMEFSLSNSEQRDNWLNSGHRTLDADNMIALSFHAIYILSSLYDLIFAIKCLNADGGSKGI